MAFPDKIRYVLEYRQIRVCSASIPTNPGSSRCDWQIWWDLKATNKNEETKLLFGEAIWSLDNFRFIAVPFAFRCATCSCRAMHLRPNMPFGEQAPHRQLGSSGTACRNAPRSKLSIQALNVSFSLFLAVVRLPC